MAQKWKNPAVQGGVRCASDWRHNPDISIFGNDIKYPLRLSRCQRWHGLSGARATLIASLVFDGGRR